MNWKEKLTQYYSLLQEFFKDNHLVIEFLSIPLTLILCFLAFLASSHMIRKYINPYIKAVPKHRFLNLILDENPLHKLAHILPGLLLYHVGGLTPIPNLLLQNMATIWIGWALMVVMMDFMDGALSIYNTFEVSRDKPLKVFAQVLKLILWGVGIILTLSLLLNQSPIYLLSGLGALTAVLMLIFKDTIMSIVASLQIQAHDMIRIGDWIEMPKFYADGDVIDIALHTVKVQNWDKTITTIPMQKFIEESFRNWRGMTQSGGRRICRNLRLDAASVRFLDQELLEKLKKVHLLKDYLQTRQEEIDQYNKNNSVDQSCVVNGRRMTNLGTFRAYILSYLKNSPRINQDMTMIVRQMEPTSEGVPLQIYCFTSTTAWVPYEGIQSDLFDHLLAVAPEFGLRVFQNPSGNDIQNIGHELRNHIH